MIVFCPACQAARPIGKALRRTRGMNRRVATECAPGSTTTDRRLPGRYCYCAARIASGLAAISCGRTADLGAAPPVTCPGSSACNTESSVSSCGPVPTIHVDASAYQIQSNTSYSAMPVAIGVAGESVFYLIEFLTDQRACIP